MKRNPNIELFRCLLMFGICLLHVIGACGSRWHWLSSSLWWCVNAFVFVSGYYGCHFRWVKVVKLYGIACYCATVGLVIGFFMNDVHGGPIGVWRYWFADLTGCWFLNAYLALLLISPVVDAGVEKLWTDGRRHLIIPCLALVFGWSWLASYNFTADFVPRTSGLQPFSVLTLLGIYIVGRIARCAEVEYWLNGVKREILFIAFIFFWLIGLLKISHFNSVFAMATAILAFYLVTAANFSGYMQKSAVFLAPSMFSVLLLHLTMSIRCRIPEMTANVDSWGGLVAMFSVALMLFLGGVIVDAFRRLMVHLLLKVVQKFKESKSDKKS